LVGTTSVGYSGVDLTVGDTTDSQNGVAIQTSTTGIGYLLFGDGTGASSYVGQIRYAHSDNSMTFRTNAADALTLDSSGNVGIGTSSPAHKLVVSGSSSTDFDALILRNSNGTNGSAAVLTFETSSGTEGDDAASAAHIRGIREDSGTDGALAFSTTLAGTPAERMRIDSSGNVGIGTDSPTETLELGDGSSTNRIKIDSATKAHYIGYDGSDDALQIAAQSFLKFQTGGSFAEAMRITSSGLVGIGTSSPTTFLDINSGGTSPVIRLTSSAVGQIPFKLAANIPGVSNSGFSIVDETASANRLVINSSGNVGIGTTSPTTQVTASQSANISQVAITSSSNAVAWNATAAANAYHVTTENTTFAAPTNPVEGAIISVEIAQGATAYTVAWNTVFEFAASTAPTVTATANKTDIFTFRYNGSVWQEIGRTQNMAQT